MRDGEVGGGLITAVLPALTLSLGNLVFGLVALALALVLWIVMRVTGLWRKPATTSEEARAASRAGQGAAGQGRERSAARRSATSAALVIRASPSAMQSRTSAASAGSSPGRTCGRADSSVRIASSGSAAGRSP